MAIVGDVGASFIISIAPILLYNLAVVKLSEQNKNSFL